MTKITERNESSSLLIVDKALLESVLESHIKVLDTLRDWTNSDDFLWIQYAEDTMLKDIGTLRAALAPVAVEPVSSRHPVVVHWRNDGIEACAGIADAYGSVGAARDMRAMITPPPAEVPLLTHEEVWAIWNGEIGLDAMNQQEAFKFARFIEQAVRHSAGLK